MKIFESILATVNSGGTITKNKDGDADFDIKKLHFFKNFILIKILN